MTKTCISQPANVDLPRYLTRGRIRSTLSGFAFSIFWIMTLLAQPAFAGLPMCFGVNDNGIAAMWLMVPSVGASPLPSGTVITMNRGFNAEGSAFRATNQKMYLFQCNSDNTGPCDLYEATIDFGTNTANAVLVKANVVPSGDRAVEGAMFEVDSSGTEFLYASVGEGAGASSSGQIYKWDPNNSWNLEPGYPLAISGDTTILTGLAYDARNDVYLGAVDIPAADGSSNNADIYSIDLVTGVATFQTELALAVDGEGLAFGADGELYTEEDQGGVGGRTIYAVDTATGTMQPAATFPGTADAESLACNVSERSDMGDGPASYGYAVHAIPVFDGLPSPVHLGSLRPDNDDDPVAQAGASADGDDNAATAPNGAGTNDEDGVTQGGASLQNQSFQLGASYTLTVATSGQNSGVLNAWLDFNADGDFDDVGEQIATNAAGTPGGTINLFVTIPPGSPAGPSYARFRYSSELNLPSADDLSAGEAADDGEVEDYRIDFVGVPLGLSKNSDDGGNADGSVRGGDTITYSIDLSYAGAGVLSNVTVSDAIPANTSYVADSDSPEAVADADPLIWNLGSNTAAQPVSIAAVAGGTTSLSASKDGYIREDEASKNYGDQNDIVVSVEAGSTTERRGVVQWDLNSLTAGATVTAATLEFYSNGDKNVVVDVQRLSNAWIEGDGTDGQDVDWLNRQTGTAWTTPGGDFDAAVVGSFTQDNSNEWDVVSGANVTALVQGWLDGAGGGGFDNNGVILISDGSVDKDEAKIRTREHDPNLAPRLVVTLQGSAGTTANLSAVNPLVGDGDTITVTMTLTSDIGNGTTDVVTPGALTVVDQAGGADAVSCTTPASQSITANVALVFTYTCTAQAGTSLPSSVSFEANPSSSNAAITFVADAIVGPFPKSNSVLIAPELTFQVTVADPIPVGVTEITNEATITEDFRAPGTASVTDPIIALYSFTGISYATLDEIYYRDPNGTLKPEEDFFVGGPGFAPTTQYTVAYYDGEGDLVPGATEGVTSNGSGFLPSRYTAADDDLDTTDQSFAYGTWTAVAFTFGTTPPATAAAAVADPAALVADVFDVRSWSTTEFTDTDNGTSVTRYEVPSGEDTAFIRVTDLDRNRNPASAENVNVTIADTESGDTITVTLIETGTDTGVFTLPTGIALQIGGAACTPPDTGDAILCVTNTSDLDADYIDSDDPADASEDIVTTPVTLAAFHAEAGERRGDVNFAWTTATEVGNVGFDLFVHDQGTWSRVNAAPIASLVGDSVTPQAYHYQAHGVVGKRFALIDIDLHGKQTVHGPFQLTRRYGSISLLHRKPIDWQPIARNHESKKQLRQAHQRKLMAQSVWHLRNESRHWPAQQREHVDEDGRSAADRTVPRVPAAATTGGTREIVHFNVDQTAVHRVTYEALLGEGIDLKGINIDHLNVMHNGMTIASRVKGQRAPNNRRRFGPGAFVEFVGVPNRTLYTRTNVYTLIADRRGAHRVRLDNKPVRRGVRAPGYYMETLTFDAPAKYSFAAPNGDPWYAERMLAWNGAYSKSLNISLDHYFGGAAPPTLEVNLWGGTDWPHSNDHHVTVAVNDYTVADVWFDGVVTKKISVDLPRYLLREQTNTLRLTVPNDNGAEFDLVNLDGYSLTYPRRFVARDSKLTFTAAGYKFHVRGLSSKHVSIYRVARNGSIFRVKPYKVFRRETGDFAVSFRGTSRTATYHVVSRDALASPRLSLPKPPPHITGGDAQYLIISHPDFIGAQLDRLVALRQRDFSVKVVDVRDIYAQFSHHIVDPQAIKRFIHYAYTNMGTRYVLLVGGDTYDYHDSLGTGSISFVPTLYAKTDDIVHFAPTDALYADIDDDQVPDLAIGRFPVRTDEELGNLVDQTLAYAEKDYERTAVFAADGYDTGAHYSFSNDSNDIEQTYLQGWQVTRAHIDELGVSATRARLVDGINSGAALTSFFGHSGPSVWTFDGLFSNSDVASLTNVGKPTLVTQWGCWNTYYVSPTEDTMGHAFMLNGDRGAAALLGASTLTEASAEKRLAEQLFARLLQSGMYVGDAMLQAKRAFAINHPNQLDVILGWTQLGDPALVVQPD